MNRKIITSVGIVLLTVGTIGGIWSGIQAMPKIINNIQIARENQSQKEVVYNTEERIVKLNIDSKVSQIFIKKHDKPNVVVERSGNKEISSITTECKNNELIIKEELLTKTRNMKSIGDMVDYFISEMYSSHSSEIIIYLPEKVEANIVTQYNSITVEDDIILNTLNYETSDGYISLNDELNLQNLNIKSLSHINLSVDEISGIKNIKVIADSVNIHGDNSIRNQSNIPENIEIQTTSKDYDVHDITINSDTPISKNLVIDSTSTVDIDLPIVDYKFNFDIKALRGIKFEASSYGKYNNTPLEKYFKDVNYDEEKDLIKEINGVINEENNNNENEYFIKIKSGYTIFN